MTSPIECSAKSCLFSTQKVARTQEGNLCRRQDRQIAMQSRQWLKLRCARRMTRNSMSDIVQKLRGFCHTLRHDGSPAGRKTIAQRFNAGLPGEKGTSTVR